MKKTAAIFGLACAVTGLTVTGVTSAQAADQTQPTTKTMTWFMEGSVHGETTWPQPLYTNQCGWLQVDTYKYATDIERAKVDSLDDDGYLRLVNGSPEDSSVYISHYYKEVPCTTPTPTSTPTPSPTPTGSPTPTPEPSETTPEPSPTTTPSPTSTPSSPTEPVPTGTPSPTTSQTVTPVVPSESPTSTGTSQTSTGPGLAATGTDTPIKVGIGLGAIGLGAFLVFMNASHKRQEDD